MQHVFISYCSEDEDFTESLSDKIKQAGFVAWKDVLAANYLDQELLGGPA